MSEEKYDLVILGGGTAGYVSAIRASQLGKKVALVENNLLGGTCLHKGCIPTKALLKSAEVMDTVKRSSEFGIDVDNFKLNFKNIQQRKNDIVNQMHNGVNHLMDHNKIDVFNGTGRILGPSIFSPQSGTISVEYEDGESDLIPNSNVLICTGSEPISLPFLPFDHNTILSSSDILALEQLPNTLAIIGGGVIGLEFASLMNDFGVEVSVIEAGERILPTESKNIANTLKSELTNKGVKFYENTQLTEEKVTVDNESVTFNLEDSQLTVDKVLVSIGRKPRTEDIGLNNTKIKTTDKGHIIVNEYQQTDDKHIYAAGDCIGKLQLAHVGSKEGMIAVEHMSDQQPLPLDYNKMPRCVYTQPEVASIGLNIDEAKQQGYKARAFKVSFKAIGKAVIEDTNNQNGFCEIVIDQNEESVLGLNMIGPHVTELINEVSLLQFMDGSTLELGLTTHAHPSLSEVLMELGLKVENRSIHV
ncbi:dihydrolipoyl dehydrogenase [Staphylococcus kloosii]|jgi:dihydrolipoamide dehydrogenase|uniref:Dihydrolipoyl dehydrogenase n=1 Tax=Staphylococcus kloosii TaxID=29384 RepID=A0ABQ0XQZ1_9STAP|nr:dihydrolipoyl dehydrogenase [Staphylococcus kloosii]AVQ36130.1 dihydrolipoyl dehydrogenase [Staphylococcus kloosii]PNZ06795.1 dihydrolipoyl dehydrogenase [Staphylococcus kloosii]PTJ74007.1 dihydrolipoyl dehydrogenase [Staphylococcus kloosii]SUM49209.1 dihydrolipoamide dehydrogenase [Staphylococcus kloosii]GEP81640.1 dihydrolipoyl dehydrogenase [Staphylococcus kloosii]